MYNTVRKYPKELKKGMIVVFYGHLFEVTEDAKNHGQEDPTNQLVRFKGNDEFDCWSASCVCIEKEKLQNDSLLRDYDGFQANSTSPSCMVSVLEK